MTSVISNSILDNSIDTSMDLNPLIRLKETIEGAQKNTSKMLTKLHRFELHLAELDTKIRPIQEATEEYTVAKQNISNTLTEVGKTYEYFRIANEVKGIVALGLNKDTQNEYFEALGRLSNAKTFFEAHREIKSSGTVLTSIESLLNRAVTACSTEFEKLLSACGKSVEFINGHYEVVNPITAEAAKGIKSICDVLEAYKHTTHFKIYQTVRSTKIKGELKELETANSSAWTYLLQDGPYEKGKHPFKEYFTLSLYLLQSELQLWGSTLPNNEESLAVFTSICESVITEIQRVLAPIIYEDVGKNKNNLVIRQSKLILIRLDIIEVFLARYEELRDICRPDVRRDTSASSL